MMSAALSLNCDFSDDIVRMITRIVDTDMTDRCQADQEASPEQMKIYTELEDPKHPVSPLVGAYCGSFTFIPEDLENNYDQMASLFSLFPSSPVNDSFPQISFASCSYSTGQDFHNHGLSNGLSEPIAKNGDTHFSVTNSYADSFPIEISCALTSSCDNSVQCFCVSNSSVCNDRSACMKCQTRSATSLQRPETNQPLPNSINSKHITAMTSMFPNNTHSELKIKTSSYAHCAGGTVSDASKPKTEINQPLATTLPAIEELFSSLSKSSEYYKQISKDEQLSEIAAHEQEVTSHTRTSIMMSQPSSGIPHTLDWNLSPDLNSNYDKDPSGIMRSKKCKRNHHGKRNCRLWEFIRNLLLDSTTNPSIIAWEDRADGSFRIVDPKKIVHIWGMKKNNERMNYEKLSRAMRYYYKRKVFLPVLGKRLVYKFGPKATGWKQ